MLTPKAEQRLKISTVPVETRAMPRTRTVGGEIVIPDGATLVVTAPLTGTLFNTDQSKSVTAGDSIAAGDVMFRLLPLLSPEREVPTAAERVAMANATASLVSSRIVAEGDVKQSEARVEAAQIALARARRLFASKAGAERDVDDAQALLDISLKGLEAASARKELLDKLTLETGVGKLAAVGVRSPSDGVLRNVSSSVGQVVSAGAPLFGVVSLNTLWVRVPIYPGLRRQLSHGNAIVRQLGDDKQVSVTPVSAPPSADSLAATVDMFFAIANANRHFHPGERVEVILPIAGEAESRIIPRAAVLRDIHGVAWVYVNSGTQTFERRRVEVSFTTQEYSVLSQGPPVGTKVVVDGAAELFGTEFGAGK